MSTTRIDGGPPAVTSSPAADMRAVEMQLAETLVTFQKQLNSGKYASALAEATELHVKCKAYYGDQHPAVASALNNMALCNKLLGDVDAAAALYTQAKDLYVAVLGKDHASTAAVHSNLGMLLLERAKRASGLLKLSALEDARWHLETALATRKRVYGESHALIAMSMYQLATAARLQRRTEEAEHLLTTAIDMLRSTVGAQHVSTATALNNFGFLMKEKGDWAAAEAAYNEAAAIRTALLGEAHPDVIAVQHNRAELCMARGDAAGADAIQREILRVMGVAGDDSQQPLPRQ